MDFSEMTYFETIDVETGLGTIERHRKALISELCDTYDRLRFTEFSASIDSLVTALEEADDLLNDLWERVTARQDELETAEPDEADAAELECVA